MEQYSYSFFLFSKLFDFFHSTDMPYDELYGEVLTMFQDYVHSEFNDEFKPEYECMVEYLSNHVPKTEEIWKK